MSGTFHLIANGLFTGFAIIGFATLSNKIGKFIKTYENEKDEHFRNAFDKTMNDTISDVHSCIESVSVITTGITKASSVGIDLISGKKVLTRKKGKLSIIEQSRAQKEQIDELSQRLKKYQHEIRKLKKKKKKHSDDEDDDVSSISSLSDEEGTEENDYTLDGKDK